MTGGLNYICHINRREGGREGEREGGREGRGEREEVEGEACG